MAQNPFGAVSGNDQNIPEAHVSRTRSTFPLHYHLFNTHRFGELIPHYVDDLTKNDRYPIHSSGTLRTYTLKSPLMQNVKRNKDYFLVPMEAILPLNWEKFFDNPVRGQDVLDDVGPTVENFWAKVYTFTSALDSALITILQDTSTPVAATVQAIFRYLILNEFFYSNGNLLSTLNCHGASYCRCQNPSGLDCSWDDLFDAYVDELQSIFEAADPNNYFTITVDGNVYKVNGSGQNLLNYYPISLRHAIQLMRDNPTFVISGIHSSITAAALKTAVYNNVYDNYSFFRFNYNVHCNLSPLWAYQLSVAHYMTNDHIDFVYSAELYRQLIGNYTSTLLSSASIFYASSRFTRNGVSYLYDFLSAHWCSLVLSFASASQAASLLTSTSATSTSNPFGVLGYLSALFGYRRSLRYLDYFTGSRSTPLAVVASGTPYDAEYVQVNSNRVSVFDITRSIQAQRFLNSVNRVRHSFEGYLKGIFGGKMPAPDYHNPFYVAHADDSVFGQETENTGAAQLAPDGSTEKALKIAVTTNLRGSGKYMFEVDSDRPCIVIGITSYDIPRVYQRTMSREFLHLNRWDWFNPFMQYTGDQPIYIQELGINPNAALANLSNFSYTLRHMEFKQKYNYCAGGFCNSSTDLDLWIFPAKDARGDQNYINPDWIRSLNAEFDQFFVSLSGWSLGTYFHFIVDDYNSVNASRPMAYSPQILG